MKFEISREGALKQLDAFINSELANYSFKRNFDLGPKDKSNVSCLSPYISHRLITEYEVAKTVLAKFPYQKVEKYIQEIFWRVYWKGWLELRPQVWTDFIEDLKGLKEDDNYKKAINGETQIECFNDWVKELKENNYLHNHTRMWFASIWIFTLNLPWQKGAEFFMKHLYDGDAASNTLSWRWVAGLQTIGKHYVATSSNISKFTNGKYRPNNLNEDIQNLAFKLATHLRERKRSAGKAGIVQGLLQEFSLSSQEGVALMCLAEALLRIPDSDTRDQLIRDKINQGNWKDHVGHSSIVFVNAAAWGLMLTGKLMETPKETSLSSILTRLIERGGRGIIRKSVDAAMHMMGEQFVTGETIQEALGRAKPLERKGFRYSYDMLGEAALTAHDAKRV